MTRVDLCGKLANVRSELFSLASLRT